MLPCGAVTPREIRRLQILDRARDVFAKKGYHQAKIDDVVAAAGVARGTFYLYFHDKRSIFEELVSRFFQKVALAVASIETDQPVEPQIRANFSRLLEVFMADPGMAKILLADATGLDVEFDRRLLAFYADLEALLSRALTEGQGLGIVHKSDPRVVAHFVIGGVKEVLLQLTRAPFPVDREAVVRDVYGILAHGVVVVAPSRAKPVRAREPKAASPRRKR